jgi:hypothetical protein
LGGARRIPRPRLGENTLLLADELVVTQAADGRWFVAVRWATRNAAHDVFEQMLW